jgi:hypothetical protein
MEKQTDIQRGFCECGCGGCTRVVNGKPNRYIKGHSARKNERYMWVDRGYETPCWEWNLARNCDGYGMAYDGRRVTVAHRVEYERHRGRIPEGQRSIICVGYDHV